MGGVVLKRRAHKTIMAFLPRILSFGHTMDDGDTDGDPDKKNALYSWRAIGRMLRGRRAWLYKGCCLHPTRIFSLPFARETAREHCANRPVTARVRRSIPGGSVGCVLLFLAPGTRRTHVNGRTQ